MSTEDTMMEQVKTLLIERSKEAMQLAKQEVLDEKLEDKKLAEALRYFMDEFWYNAAHPTLLSLACQAVEGKPKETTKIASAFVLLTGAADIHDDVIDQSLKKGDNLTVLGKYGVDISIIAGDVLWIKGILMLNDACQVFAEVKRKAILELAKEAFFAIGSAEAKETSFKRNVNLTPQQYLEIIKNKVSVSVAAAKIGATIGGATPQQIESLGRYSQTLATLMTIRDEFIDVFEVDEVKNRFQNECLPLPFLCAFENEVLKKEVMGMLARGDWTEAELQKMIELVVNSPQVRILCAKMHTSARNAMAEISWIKQKEALNLLVLSTLQNIDNEKLNEKN